MTQLCALADLGPYEMQIKNPTQGLFTIVETEDRLRAGIPALWHHKSRKNCTLEARANAVLERRRDRDGAAQDRMLAQEGRLQLARELRMAPQRVAAVLTKRPMLGVRSWITVSMRDRAPGREEALCLWLNSTPGLLARLVHGNRPYLGRSALPHELARTLPILDVNQLSPKQLRALLAAYEDLKCRPLQGFGDMESDTVRRELNERLCQVLVPTCTIQRRYHAAR